MKSQYSKVFYLHWPKAAFKLPSWFTKAEHAEKLFNALQPLCKSINTYIPGNYIEVSFDRDFMLCKIRSIESVIQTILKRAAKELIKELKEIKS